MREQVPWLPAGSGPKRASAERNWTNTRGHRQGEQTDRVDSPICKEEAEQPPPGSGASRRQLSPAPWERLQLASPRSTEHHPQSSRDRSTHADTRSALASEVARAKRAYEAAQATALRRKARRQRHKEGIELSKDAAREASRLVGRAQRSLAISAASSAAGATAPSSHPARPLGVASQESRPGDDAFMKGSVARMASTSRVEFSGELAKAVVEAASALLQYEMKVSLHPEQLSVGAAWARRGNGSFFGQMRRAPTLALVKALRMAHN